MIGKCLSAIAIVMLLASCSSMKPLNSNSAKKPLPATSGTIDANKKIDIKFLDDITANPELAASIPDVKSEKPARNEKKEPVLQASVTSSSPASGQESELKQKYASLLETDADQLQNTDLLKSVDDWYGTKYRMGGMTKKGVDCSAFVQAVYLSAFGMAIPRTAFEQFKVSNRISATMIKEGDLVFFNTTGGVSHVGIYMGNNKFVHASVARGVTVSDLFDPYYLKRFLGVGRIEKSLGNR